MAVSQGKRSKVPCGVCLGPIVEGKDEALLCEGECGLWLHRGCASVPPSRYNSLSASDEPFICLCCSNVQLRQEITQLRSELRNTLELYTNEPHQKQISDLVDTVAALRTEVSQLKEALSSVSSDLTSLRTLSKNPTYASKAATRRSAKTDGDTHHRGIATATNPSTTNEAKRPPSQIRPNRSSFSNKQSNTVQTSSPLQNHRTVNRRPCTPVAGARKVWGTLRSTTVSAVANAICSVTSIPTTDITIKRKFKSRPNDNRIKRWWFVLRGEESALQNLEGCWNQLQLQTKWKLEPVLRYSDTAACKESDQSTALPTDALSKDSVAEAASNESAPNVSESPSQQAPITDVESALN